jgi:hypothetical protein
MYQTPRNFLSDEDYLKLKFSINKNNSYIKYNKNIFFNNTKNNI